MRLAAQRPALLALTLLAPAPAALAQATGAGGGEARDAAPETDQGELQRGRRAFDDGRYALAARHAEAALRQAPGDPWARLLLAEALFWLGRYERAAAQYERVLAHGPVALAYNGLGHSYLQLATGRPEHPRSRGRLLDRAADAFARARQLEPEFAAARQGAQLTAAARAPAHPLWPLSLLCWTLVAVLAARALLHLRRTRPHEAPRALLLDLRWPLSLFVATRALIALAFMSAPGWLAEAARHPQPTLRYDLPLLDAVAARWDANLYTKVALWGYWTADASGPDFGGVGQFPLLPALLRGMSYALDDVGLAALIIPNLALAAASVVLFVWVREQHGRRTAIGATVALLVHPGSLYGSVLYAESLLLLGAVCSARHAQRGAFGSAALWGVFAGLARIQALALTPWLLWQWWRQPHPRAWPALLAAVSPVLGVAAYGLYLQVEFGDFLAYVREMRVTRLQGGNFASAPVAMRDLLLHLIGARAQLPRDGPLPLLVMALVVVAAYLAAGLALARKRAHGPALFVLAGLALSLGSTLGAQPRYLWVLFPALVPLAQACDRRLMRWLAPALALACLGTLAAAYARWYFVT